MRTPVANAYAERFGRSVRREYLDWLSIRNECHLHRILRDDASDHERPHRGRGPQAPIHRHDRQPGPIERRDRLGGLIYEDQRAASQPESE